VVPLASGVGNYYENTIRQKPVSNNPHLNSRFTSGQALSCGRRGGEKGWIPCSRLKYGTGKPGMTETAKNLRVIIKIRLKNPSLISLLIKGEADFQRMMQ
jgi:hypothetical protein